MNYICTKKYNSLWIFNFFSLWQLRNLMYIEVLLNLFIYLINFLFKIATIYLFTLIEPILTFRRYACQNFWCYSSTHIRNWLSSFIIPTHVKSTRKLFILEFSYRKIIKDNSIIFNSSNNFSESITSFFRIFCMGFSNSKRISIVPV